MQKPTSVMCGMRSVSLRKGSVSEVLRSPGSAADVNVAAVVMSDVLTAFCCALLWAVQCFLVTSWQRSTAMSLFRQGLFLCWHLRL